MTAIRILLFAPWKPKSGFAAATLRAAADAFRNSRLVSMNDAP
jgi:hypothetical protein